MGRYEHLHRRHCGKTTTPAAKTLINQPNNTQTSKQSNRTSLCICTFDFGYLNNGKINQFLCNEIPNSSLTVYTHLQFRKIAIIGLLKSVCVCVCIPFWHLIFDLL